MPFMLWFCLILLIDPFDYWGISPFQNDLLKTEIAKLSDHSRRYEFIAYKNSPKKNIILGDSQLQHLDANKIPGGRWAQLSTPGSGVEDELYLLEEFSRTFEIDSVIIGINPFEFVSQYSSLPLPITQSALKLVNEPYFYFFDRCVYSATFNYILELIFEKYNQNREVPNSTKEVFWEKQMKAGRDRIFKKTERTIREEQLKKIVEICETRKITPIIVIPLTHSDLYDIYGEYINTELLPLLKQYFGVVYNLYYPNSFTENRSNFEDPFHARNDNEIYINAIFKNDTTYCKIFR